MLKRRENRRERQNRGGTEKNRREREGRAEGKKACFFPLKGGKRKNSAAIFFFLFNKKKSKNQTKSKYDLLS